MFLDHPLLLSLGLFVLLAATVEAGFRLAVLTSPNIDEERREQIAASRDALGILLSLLLGFTLAMALPRFDLRKQPVMDEANAIGTTSLRAGVLPEAQRSQVRALLRANVPARKVYSQAVPGESQLTAAVERTKALQSSLWQQAEESARQSPTPMTALFVASVNGHHRPQRKTPHRARKPHTSNHLADAPVHCAVDLSHVRLRATTKILADRRRIAPHDRDRHGTDCGSGQSTQRFSSRRPAQPGSVSTGPGKRRASLS